MLATIRGRVLAPDPVQRRLVLRPDAIVRVDGWGTIASVEDAPPGCEVPETWPGAVVLPGLVDTHVHFPQTRVIGSASGPLLAWLQKSVFPEEARFSDRVYAEEVAREFCDALVRQGTTCAAIYSSAHPVAAEVLLEVLEARGLRAVVGLALMDRGAPPDVLLPAADALAACEVLHARWHDRDRGRLRVSAIPRFAISCTPQLLRGAAAFADRHHLLVQTHISENRDEVEQTLQMFPEARDYLGVYEDHGLVSSRTILAHCIHLGDGEWTRVKGRDVAVAHCPDSNFFLGSGCMPLRDALDRGVRVGLGTDVGAGRSFSVRRVAASAYDAALVRGDAVRPEELLWLATRGGADVVGERARLGCVEAGFDADLVAIDAAPTCDIEALVDALLFRHDAGPVRATVVRGRVL
jgi:guanine deaminase